MYGDVHAARRAALGVIPYRHFGIEMPDGGICENSPRGVRVVAFGDFARGSLTVVRNPGANAGERAEAVHRAASRIGERCYSLTGNNCEHFVNSCATGVAISRQVIEFFRMLAAIAKAALTAAAVALALSATRTALAE